jgi:hypothetical protein
MRWQFGHTGSDEVCLFKKRGCTFYINEKREPPKEAMRLLEDTFDTIEPFKGFEGIFRHVYVA